MESGRERKTGSDVAVELSQLARRCSGEFNADGLVFIAETSLQRRKVESDALKMREFLAEGDVSSPLNAATRMLMICPSYW
jgi:hypothetical protein